MQGTMEAAVRRLGTLFYLVEPNATTFQHAEEVPNYINEALPVFTVFMVLEVVMRWLLGERETISDVVSGLSSGILFESVRVLMSGTVLVGYEWLYQYRIFDLPWNSLYTWLITFVLVDFWTYWIHRANHEINIIWAVHQIHHLSENYNLSTGLRLSIFQKTINFNCYYPMALLGIPFPSLLAHNSLNLVYQFWLHTTVIGKLGPLEYVIGTPSFHRVHHGANNWCLDKNYASVLAVWDFLFGTYEMERDDTEIVYGLTQQPQTHNALYHQVYYFGEVFRKARSMSTWKDSLKAVFYGPGWTPGSPRLGDPAKFPVITAPRPKYDPKIPQWQLLYATSHMVVTLLIQQVLLNRFSGASWVSLLMFGGFIFYSLGVVTAMLDGSWWAGPAEVVRCTVYIFNARSSLATHISALDTVLILCYTFSAIIWTCHSLVHRYSLLKTDKLH
ncbi:alkylglycerol monooxygenase-like [Eriocheir sinensis]|uniref:alkylglycerol monooxygenase-like n=1 Tax=Eriocheir sinensis TaxID=95602 RepID=UPI0021C82B5A|nr:alkylglycerol monooxygenase-like [Eriocheir sinensis]XP_050716130.1 alkylglycerol monooxygenase-like [Eriocheir sinensis]